MIDMKGAAHGIVRARYRSKERLKLKVCHEGLTATHDLRHDGLFDTFPLTFGSGRYEIRLFERVQGTEYRLVEYTSRNVQLVDKYQPYLRPSKYCRWSPGDDVTIEAAVICRNSHGARERIDAVYAFVSSTIAYDHEKAVKLSGGTGYVPDPNTTLHERRGVCFDQASLMAAMLRSRLVPTKLVSGWRRKQDGEFEPHAWVVAHDGERWCRCDPVAASEGKSSKDFEYIDGMEY